MTRGVECPILVPPEKKDGDYANAFRMVQDSGTEWFLDFLFCDGKDAKVVSRIRVQEEFLPSIRERLCTTLGEVPDDMMVVFPTKGE